MAPLSKSVNTYGLFKKSLPACTSYIEKSNYAKLINKRLKESKYTYSDYMGFKTEQEAQKHLDTIMSEFKDCMEVCEYSYL